MAEQDPDFIGEYIAADKQRRAIIFIRIFRQQCERITRSAWLPVVVRTREGARPSVYGRYMIFFEVSERTVVVVRIRHDTRDLLVPLRRQRRNAMDVPRRC